MLNQYFAKTVAEGIVTYQSNSSANDWVEVLVDCPGVQGLYTYRREETKVKPGDIVTVPFGSQTVGGIAICLSSTAPTDLEVERIRTIEAVVARNFFPDRYWELIRNVAQYYGCDLMSVVRVALPPGLLGRSQPRIKLNSEAIPPGAVNFCSRAAAEVLQMLQAQKEGDYSTQYLKRKLKYARRGIRELLKRGWIESYLEPPKLARPKLQKAVTLISQAIGADITGKQREVIECLRRNGGEMWQSELLQKVGATAAVITSLQTKGYAIAQLREKLRLLTQGDSRSDQPKELNAAQAAALEQINRIEGWGQVLLHGVTGSGKTEVYLQAIAPRLEQGRSVLVLVPEIGLTPQLTDRFRARFGDRVWVYHSGLSDGERYDTWRQMLSDQAQIIIGTRSAVFAPLPNLGLVILDEEHDSSFKQHQPTPTYHARQVAVWRTQMAQCPLVLGSATPASETWIEAHSPQSTSYYLSLPQRIAARPLPEVQIVDMRRELAIGNRSIFSRRLQAALDEIQAEQQQAILFVPRRGHSTFVSCRSCGYVIECPNCDVSLSYHYEGEGGAKLLRCHYCNYTNQQPSHCPQCGSPYLKFFGSGTQRVTQELQKNFPQLRCIRFDSDTTRTKGAHRNLIERFTAGEADVLIGTQMLTKGLDIEGVTLVGVVAADGILHRSDYRAAEVAFQTLTQVAGRAGRGSTPGRVIVQTYSPQHRVIASVESHDYPSFIETELQQRAELGYPPYGKLILVKITGSDETEVELAAERIANACAEIVSDECEILGPAPASVGRVARRYRWQILLKYPASSRPILPDWPQLRRLCPTSVSMSLDIDPLGID